MKAIICFDENGIGQSVVEIDKQELLHNEFELPEEFVGLLPAQRFTLVSGEIVDSCHGMTTEEASAAIAQALASAEAERVAQAKGFTLTTLEGARAYRIKQVRDHFEKVMQDIRADAAPYEIETWGVQRDEYVRYITDNNSPTPYVDTLAKIRGLERADLFARIGANVERIAAVQGLQHKTEKAVLAATSIEELDAIQIEI